MHFDMVCIIANPTLNILNGMQITELRSLYFLGCFFYCYLFIYPFVCFLGIPNYLKQL